MRTLCALSGYLAVKDRNDVGRETEDIPRDRFALRRCERCIHGFPAVEVHLCNKVKFRFADWSAGDPGYFELSEAGKLLNKRNVHIEIMLVEIRSVGRLSVQGNEFDHAPVEEW